MAEANIIRSNFSSGELSPLMSGRSDHPRYANGAEIIENWTILTQGGITRRNGTRYANNTRNDGFAILLPFEPAVDDAYQCEFGANYIRIYRDGARLGTVELATPYTEAQLRLLRTAQANDVMIVAHGSHQPYRLSRISDTDWSFRTIRFDPPPTFEAGTSPNATLTPSDITGTITLTSSVSAFLETDVDRQIQSGESRAVITAVNSATEVSATVLDDFTGIVPIAAGQWTILKSPVAELKPSKASPAGAQIDLDLQLIQATEPELIVNGQFNVDANWTDLSGPVVTTGETDGGSGDTTVIDAAATFITSGVRIGHRAIQDGTGQEDRIEDVVSETELQTSSGGANWAPGGLENYTIRQTGISTITGGTLNLSGGEQGIAARNQAIGTIAGRRYRLVFDVIGNRASIQIGTASGLSDIQSELGFLIGNENIVVFTATTATTFIEFRNNQDNTAEIDNVSCKLFSAEGWRAEDVGKHVYVSGGLVRINSVVDGTKATGDIVTVLSTEDAAAPGWTLESAAWSDALGWPEDVILQDGRLVFLGTSRFPGNVWMSEVDGLFNNARGVNPDDAVILSIVQSGGNITLNKIVWGLPFDRLVVGTTHAEYALVGSNDDAITPTNPPKVRQGSTLGSSQVAPLLTSGSILMVQRQGSKLRELQYNPQTEKFDNRDVTIVAEHLLQGTNRILQLAYQQEPISTVWAVRSDGVLMAMTYDLTENVIGWTRQIIGGTGIVESVSVIPHPTRNATQVWLIVRRTIGVNTVRHIEYFESFDPVEPLTGQEELHLDSGVVETVSPASTTVTGLDHLNGATIQVVGDGALFDNLTVSSGQVTLPFAVSTRQSGLSYSARARPMPPDLPQIGTVRNKEKRWVELSLILHETVALNVDGQDLKFLQHGMTAQQGLPPFSGIQSVTTLGYDKDAQFDIVADKPFSATVLAIVGQLDVEAETG